jgi:hypothetical protein
LSHHLVGIGHSLSHDSGRNLIIWHNINGNFRIRFNGGTYHCIRPIFQAYATSILGSWNSHWSRFRPPRFTKQPHPQKQVARCSISM